MPSSEIGGAAPSVLIGPLASGARHGRGQGRGADIYIYRYIYIQRTPLLVLVRGCREGWRVCVCVRVYVCVSMSEADLLLELWDRVI